MDLRTLRRTAHRSQTDVEEGSGVPRWKISLAEAGRLRLTDAERTAIERCLLSAIAQQIATLGGVLADRNVASEQATAGQ